MSDLKITDLLDEQEIEKLNQLDSVLQKAKESFTDAAREMAKGLNVHVTTTGELDKLNAMLDATGRKTAASADAMNKAFAEQQSIMHAVNARLKEQVESGQLSAAQMKQMAAASKESASALDKLAAAEQKRQKMEQQAAKSTKDANMTEEQRKKVIRDALALVNKEVHSIKEAQDANTALRQAVRLLNDTDENYRSTLDKLNSTITYNTNYVKRNSDAYTQQKMTIGDYRNQIKLAIGDLQNGGSKMQNFGIIAKSFGGILRSNVAGGFSAVSDGIGNMIKGFVGAQVIIDGFRKLIAAVKDGIHAMIDFEAANSRLAAILGVTKDQIKDLDSNARKLGSTTRYTASQVTELQIELAKLGFTRSEILDSTKAVLLFAQATGAELGEAAALAGAAVRMFGDSTKNTDRYVSAMAVSTSKSALSFSKLATALPIVGPVANAFNFTIEDTLALLGKLADSGFDASAAATATRNIFLNLADSSGKLATALGGPVRTLPELVSGLITLRDRGVDLNETLEMTDKRSVAAFNAFLSSAEGIVPLREQVTGVTDDMEQMADTMNDNVQGAVYGLQSAWEGFMLTFSNSTGPMKTVIDFLTQGLRNVTDQLKTYQQLQDDRNQMEQDRVNEEMKNSDVIEKHRKNMENLYKEYLESGMKADEAAAAAKKDYIDTLKGNLESQNNTYQATIEKRKGYEQELDRSFWKTLVSWRRTNNDIKEDIQTTIVEAAGKKGLMQITQNAIDALQEIDLVAKKGSAGTGGGGTTLTKAQKQAMEQAAKERQKIAEDLAQSEVDIMAEGLEKEIAQIRVSFSKKLAAIKGNSEEEKQLRINLGIQMENEIAEATLKDNDKWKKFQEDRTKRDLATMQKYYADQAEARNTAMIMEQNALKELYARHLITKEQYEAESLRITQKYAIETAEASVKSLESLLGMSGLSDSDRLKLEQELAKAKAELAKKTADIEIENEERVTKKAEEETRKRMQLVEQYMQYTSQMIGAMADLFINMYEGRIQKIEEEQRALDDSKDKELDRIEQLAEAGAISAEEAEARKRAAEQRTAQRTQELEKKKADLQYKQAVWDKAASLAQAAIATALAVTKALPNIPLSVIVGALGAVQMAAIAAQPIPKYAKGTDDHPGGAAIVGDGGKRELIAVGDRLMVTPDRPTLVNLPRHARVYPDADEMRRTLPLLMNRYGDIPRMPEVSVNSTVTFEDSAVLRAFRESNELLKYSIRQSRSLAAQARFENYKRTRL